MTNRHTADTITDDALDALYEQLDARDAALATYTAQLQRDQAALARVRAVLADPAALDWRQRIRDAITGPKPDTCCGKPPGAVCVHDVTTPADHTTEN